MSTRIRCTVLNQFKCKCQYHVFTPEFIVNLEILLNHYRGINMVLNIKNRYLNNHLFNASEGSCNWKQAYEIHIELLEQLAVIKLHKEIEDTRNRYRNCDVHNDLGEHAHLNLAHDTIHDKIDELINLAEKNIKAIITIIE